jgi:RNA polymerase sigma-70 factor (ECF subfamily)
VPAALSLAPAFIDELTATISDADAETLREMLPAVYHELRGLAANFLRDEHSCHTLQPTALVHEAYLRIADQRQTTWQNRAQLFGIFAQMMRRILIDRAKARLAGKRGGKDAVRITLDDSLEISDSDGLNLLEIDEVLRRLEAFAPQQAKIVEMRFFGGLTIDEIAKAMDISRMTVNRSWAVAKRWLRRELSAAA